MILVISWHFGVLSLASCLSGSRSLRAMIIRLRSGMSLLDFVLASNNSLLSASLDGTIRSWDLFLYQNFRTSKSLSPRKFVSLTADSRTLYLFEVFFMVNEDRSFI